MTVLDLTLVVSEPTATAAGLCRCLEADGMPAKPSAAELDALAGPAAGPNGTQVFVDGFTASNGLPDKQTIREIVINQNPFAAEFERIGFGNIQIFTKPGTAKFHGGSAFTFSDAVFNARAVVLALGDDAQHGAAVVAAPGAGAQGRDGAGAAGHPAGGGALSRAQAVYSLATCKTSLPKFSPLKSLSSVSGKVSRPATTSSLLFITPSFRYCAISATARW